MMDIEEFINLVSTASNGRDNLKKGTVVFNGYGFFFADPFKSNESFITVKESSKFTDAGSYRGITEQILLLDRIKCLDDLGPSDDKEDCRFAGSLKTLVPTLEFGGDELFFYV